MTTNTVFQSTNQQVLTCYNEYWPLAWSVLMSTDQSFANLGAGIWLGCLSLRVLTEVALTKICSSCLYVPPTKGEGEHFAFGADPVSFRARAASCLHSIFWTNGWILTKLALEGGNKWLDFYSYTIFEVTSNFDQKHLSAPCLLNQISWFGQTSYIVTLGWFKDLIRFWWPWSKFQGHHTIKNKDCKKSLVLNLSPETNNGFSPNLLRNIIGTWKRND